jgi:uncharacterized protein
LERNVNTNVWAISDGAPGNARQAEALAAGIARQAAREHEHTDGRADVPEVSVQRVVLQPRRPWSWLAPRQLPGAVNAFGAGFAAQLQGPMPMLAIGCGRQAALATRLLRARGCRAVQILDPRIDPSHWDLVVAPAHDGLGGNNVLSTLGSLNPIDDDWLADMRGQWPQPGSFPSPRTVVLLGGPTADAPFTVADWQRLAEVIDIWLQRDGGSVLVASSRRTPTWLATQARRHFVHRPGAQWHGEADGPNPFPGFLAWAERIVVTADSANLLSEACATGVPVLCPTLPRRGSRIARLHQALLDTGRLRPLERDYQPWQYPPLRETADIARTLWQRLALQAG